MPIDGTLDYIELPGSDLPATKKFYREVFDWTFTDFGPEYTAFEAQGRNGGFNAALKVVSGGGPLIVLYANKLDAMEAKVKAARSSATSASQAAAASTSAIPTATNWRCGVRCE